VNVGTLRPERPYSPYCPRSVNIAVGGAGTLPNPAPIFVPVGPIRPSACATRDHMTAKPIPGVAFDPFQSAR
jgi:hypothetical protein